MFTYFITSYTSINLREILEGGMTTKQSISFTLFPHNKKHVKVCDLITKIEDDIEKSILNHTHIQSKQIYRGMKPQKKYDRDDYRRGYNNYSESESDEHEIMSYQLRNVKITNNEKNIYLKGQEHMKYTFEDAVSLGFLGKGSCVKALIKIVGVWDCGPYHSM